MKKSNNFTTHTILQHKKEYMNKDLIVFLVIYILLFQFFKVILFFNSFNIVIVIDYLCKKYNQLKSN